MNADDILNVIENTPDEFVRDAHKSKSSTRKKQIINLAVGAAACIVLVPILALGSFILFGRAGSAAPAAPADPAAPAEPAGGPTHYTGPVLCLTPLESSEGITAEQSLDISFEPIYDESKSEPFVQLTDSYVLTNSTYADIRLTMVYPYVSSCYDSWLYGNTPVLSVDGVETAAEVVYGPYSGTFIPVYGAEHDPEMATANLYGPDNFNAYATLLADGSYLECSFHEIPQLDQSVIVYRLSDYEYTSDTLAPNPTLNFRYEADSSKTQVLTWNFNGGSNFDEEGLYERHTGGIEVRPQASPENIYPEDAYLIILGDDISNYSVAGYPDGGCEKGKELPDLGCSITRYEATLGEVLRELIETQHFYGNEFSGNSETIYPIVAAALMDFGPIGENPVTRYNHGFLDNFVYDVIVQNRIAYLSFPITVPAGGSVEVELQSLKALSYNHYGSGDTSVFSLEYAGSLGSSLRFTESRASLSDFEGIEIVGGNFGLDIASGETETLLDPNTPHYYMDIREKPMEE